jgi:hypothetical protein
MNGRMARRIRREVRTIMELDPNIDDAKRASRILKRAYKRKEINFNPPK